MAVLTDPRRAALWSELMAQLSADHDGYALSKAELRAAVNAIDDFLSANASALNTAIPLPARTVLTTPQKARLLTMVVRYRYLDGT